MAKIASFVPPESIHKGQRQPSIAHRQAGQAVETMFLNYLVKTMLSSVEKSDFLGGGFAEKMVEPLLAEKIAEKMAQRGMGVGTIVAADLARTSALTLPTQSWVAMVNNQGEEE
jgi:Rod binding domain-containing protein